MKKDLLVLGILILPAFSPLIQKGYFPMHDDLQSLRQYQMDLCFKDGQIPCRWVPDMGYGYGYPLFNYYPPLPYLLGQIYRGLGFAYIDVVKLIGITAFVLTGVFMYLLGRELWGRLGGFISAAFYTYAPYHSVDFYVRGAMNEFWAMCFYPLIFWCTYRLVRNPKWFLVPGVSVSVAGLMLSHNPMLMIFAPVYLTWIIYLWWRFKSLKSSLPLLLVSALWAFGLAAFFTLPVIFEQKYASVWTLTSGYFNYLAHYLNIRQIFFDINWGYGSSELGPKDTMSFALGHLHWLVPGIIILLTPFVEKLRKEKTLLILLTFFVLASLFMTHSKSTPIWLALKPLEFLQFPWRFLTISVFSASLLSGAAALFLGKKLVTLLFTILILLNGNYFRPREWYPDMTDEKKFSGSSWQLLVTSGIFDYLPIWASRPPADPAIEDIRIIEGTGSYARIKKKTNIQKYQISISSPTATIQLQTYYFPGWKVWINGVERKIDPLKDNYLGRIEVDVPKGSHELLARFTDTPIRVFGNSLSIIAWFGMILACLPSFISYLSQINSLVTKALRDIAFAKITR